MKADTEKCLFSTTSRAIRDFIKGEREIDKIAKGLCKEPKAGNGLSEKRELVYNFFKSELPKINRRTVYSKTLQTVCYIDCEGKRKSFNIGYDEYNFYEVIEVEGGGKIYFFPHVHVVPEYVRLHEFDKLLNSRTENFAFTDMLGQKIEEVVQKYNLRHIGGRWWIGLEAGNELYRVLRRNDLYWKTKSSFQRALKEFECYERARRECEKVFIS